MRLSTLFSRSLNKIDLMQLLVVFIIFGGVFLSQSAYSQYAWLVFIFYWVYLAFFVVRPQSLELG